MDFLHLDWLGNWQFPTASLTDLDNSNIPSPIDKLIPADQDHNGQPHMSGQSFYSSTPGASRHPGALSELWTAETHCAFSEPPEVNSDLFKQSNGTTMVETFVPILHSMPNRPNGPPTRSGFPQSVASVIPHFYSAYISGHLYYHCSWPTCGSIDAFKGLQTIQDHVERVHVAAVQAAWPGCKWPNCESKKGSFATQKRLEEHLQNIHIEPLICAETSCSHKRPFGKPGDLLRHHRSKHAHGSELYECPRTSCPKPIHGFARRDKLREHLRNWHGNFECLVQGCRRGPGNGFRTEEQLLSHTRTQAAHKTLQAGCPLPHCETSNTSEAELAALLDEHFEAIHGDYNCELGICGQARSSEFVPYTLKKHLIKDHDISSSGAMGLVDALVKAGECVLKDSQLARLGWAQGQRGPHSIHTRMTFMECLSCSLASAVIPAPSI